MGGKVLVMLKGGRNSFRVVFLWKLEVLAILKREVERGSAIFHPVLRGERKSFGPPNLPFLAHGVYGQFSIETIHERRKRNREFSGVFFQTS